MTKQQKQNFRAFAKFILLAQTASDAGKSFISSKSGNASKAIEINYGLKDKYIEQAISFGKKCPNVEIGHDDCQNVVLFNIKGYGQISFHSFKDWGYVRFPDKVVWNGVYGGSIMSCKRLAKKLNLPFYKHN